MNVIAQIRVFVLAGFPTGLHTGYILARALPAVAIRAIAVSIELNRGSLCARSDTSKFQAPVRRISAFGAAARSSRLSLGGPLSSNPATAAGGYTVALYGKPAPVVLRPPRLRVREGPLRDREAAPRATAGNGYFFRLEHLAKSLATGKLEWQQVRTSRTVLVGRL